MQRTRLEYELGSPISYSEPLSITSPEKNVKNVTWAMDIYNEKGLPISDGLGTSKWKQFSGFVFALLLGG